uniref:Uncharacterized protein n=1 Tax=Varanus komodoensis TaxID=61221 RepID=A0A8D2IVS8_VARKO
MFPLHGLPSMLNLDGSTTSRDVVKFVATYLGPHLHSLCLRGSSLTESSFEELLLSCPCLTALDLSGCNSLFMSGTLFSKEICLQAREALVHLQELNLSGIRYLSDLTFNHLTSCSSHLANNGYSSVLEQARTVKALDLSGTSISRQSMKSLVQVEHLNLQELVLQACQDLTNEAVSIMCQHQPHLTTLDLTGCSELSDQAVLVISSQLLDLRCLRLGKLPRLTDAGFRGISHLRYLQSLDVSECSLVSSSTLIQAFHSRWTSGKASSLSEQYDSGTSCLKRRWALPHWFDHLVVQGTHRSLRQHHNSKTSILQRSVFLMVQLSQPYIATGKTIALTICTFVGRVVSLLFSMLSRFAIAFLPRSKPFNFLAAVPICGDLGAQENKICHYLHFFPIYLPGSERTRCHDLSFLNVEFQANFCALLLHPHQEAL